MIDEIVQLRRAIHAEPELGLHTPATAAKVRAASAGLPLEWREGPSTSGMVALLRGPHNGRTVLLRGDMDALSMTEDTGLPFASTIPGRMHACGHDAHTAMLVGAAKLLCARRDELAGSVMFMFQPGEEGFQGARHMLEDGLLDPLPDAAFALHVLPNARFGEVSGRAGPLMASMDTLRVTITGQGCHAAMPHDGVDPIPVACEIVGAIQSFVTRRIPAFDPAVVTITKIEAGTSHNVIPATAHLLGTIRAVSAVTRAAVGEGLHRLIEGIAAAQGASAHVEIDDGGPVTVCDLRAVEIAREAATALFGAGAWVTRPTPMMGGEDFAFVLEKVPGAMLFLGAAPDGEDARGREPLHSTRMTLDENVLARGAALHAAIAERFLADGFAAA